jgi:hypothetical protein
MGARAIAVEMRIDHWSKVDEAIEAVGRLLSEAGRSRSSSRSGGPPALI